MIAVEEPADHVVGLARAAMPGAEAQALEAGVAVHRCLVSANAGGRSGASWRMPARYEAPLAMRPELLNPLFAEVDGAEGRRAEACQAARASSG